MTDLIRRKNHPHTTVLCADSNKVLKAVRGDKSVKDEYNKPFPPLPKPCTADKASSIDFVFGGMLRDCMSNAASYPLQDHHANLSARLITTRSANCTMLLFLAHSHLQDPNDIR